MLENKSEIQFVERPPPAAGRPTLFVESRAQCVELEV